MAEVDKTKKEDKKVVKGKEPTEEVLVSHHLILCVIE